MRSCQPAASAVVLSLLAAASAGCNNPPSQAPAPGSAPASAPTGAAKPGPRVFVTDETGTEIVVVDPEGKTIVQRIKVGKRPRGVRLSHDGARLYVALSGSPIGGPNVDESKLPPADRAADGIGVVDLATGAVVRKYQSGPDPEAFSLSKDGGTMFVSNEETGEMTAVDLESGAIKGRVKVGDEPEGVTTSPDGTRVFVACEASNEVIAIDTATLKIVGRVTTGPRPRSIAFTPDGRVGFVGSENAGTLSVFDGTTMQSLRTIQFPGPTEPGGIPPRPMGQQLSADASTLFVTLGRAKGIAIVDVASRTFQGVIADVGARPWGIGISPDGRKLYTANGPSGDVSIVDIASGRTEARIAVGGSPWGIAVGSSR